MPASSLHRRSAGIVPALLLLVVSIGGPVVGQSADAPSIDAAIRERDLWHDSRDDRYRTPTGATPAGTLVKLRLRSAAGDVETAQARFTDRASGDAWAVPMELVATDPHGGEFGYDYWQVEVPSRPSPAILDYTFVVQDGLASRHLFDDRAMDGGAGEIGRKAEAGRGWQLTFYDPGFVTPAWTAGAVVYQVFPDRFANGDPSNDPSPEASPGPEGAERYRRGDVYGEPILRQPWSTRPENYCRAYVESECPESVAFNRDFFGGDLAGLTEQLDPLADLGVTVIYLNPIFASPSNHRYDTTDYAYIDPGLGTVADFETLVEEAADRDIRILLDGVFNHVSSDSPWFDRLRRFEELGACESAESPYRDWFTFKAPGPKDPTPCAPSEPGGDDRYYQGWFSYDTIPELKETATVTDLIAGPDGVVRRWIDLGASGWRLDAADVMSPEFIVAIREAAKAADPDSLIVAEQWHDSTPWLLGDQADSTMNYRFRRAVIGLVNGATADSDGAIEALAPNGFANAMLGVQEDYPAPAYRALMNLVDSHDTARIQWTLTPGIDNDEAKSMPAAVADGKVDQRLVSTIQLTMPGMATVYYGDEVGLSGHDDPDNRRPYPWGDEDLELRDHYRTLARLRADHAALREGGLEFLLADDARRTLAYLRRSESAAALVVLNLGDRPRELEIDVAGRVPDGTKLTDALGGYGTVGVADGAITIGLASRSAAVLTSADDAELTPPASPSGLLAEAGPSRVDLAWDAVDGAAGYAIWRSLLSGGGYEPLGTTEFATFSDDEVRDGVPYYYTVTARDESGNVSSRSSEAVAVPQLALVRLDLVGLDGGDGMSPTTITQTLWAVDGAVAVNVRVDAGAPGDRIARGIIVETGIGPLASDPRDEVGWTWTRADVTGAADETATFSGSVQPESLGGHAVAARASSDGGETYVYAEQLGQIDAVPSTDTEPPPAPYDLAVIDVAGDRVQLHWAEPTVPGLQRYLVWRAEDPAGPFTVIGTTAAPVFLDATVVAGKLYTFMVQAQDLGFNTSASSEAITVAAAERLVNVVFTVVVPAGVTGGDVHIAGDFQGWDPATTPMTRLDDVTWSITLPFEDRKSIQYKYTRGTWEAVEKDGACEEITNRALTTDYGSDGTQAVSDTVAKWRDLDACP